MHYMLASVGLLLVLISPTPIRVQKRSARLAVLDFGPSTVGKMVAQRFRSELEINKEVQLIDPDLSTAAARGVGYAGSLNLSLAEARDLGAAMAADFYLIGDAQTLRRSSFSRPIYYETYVTVFAVSSRSGSLVYWDRIAAESDTAEDSEKRMLESLKALKTVRLTHEAIRKAEEEESNRRQEDLSPSTPVIQEAPEDDIAASAQGLRLPRPYRRLRPAYPQSAAVAEVEATVDVLVDIGADGEVGQIRVARWAGFGLDESTVETVRQLHFFPAMRNGTPIPMRVLLRYNFRKPSQ